MQRIKNIFVHNIKLIVLLVCVLSVVIFAIVGSSYTVHAAETKNLEDLKNDGVWNYKKYGNERNMTFITSYGGFSVDNDKQTEATINIIYRKNIPGKDVVLYTTECEHIQGLETTASIYIRKLTEEEYAYTLAVEFNMRVGKIANVVCEMGGGNLWGNSSETSSERGKTKTCKAIDPSCRVVGEATAKMSTYYWLTINITRDLIWQGSGSGKHVSGYKNYRVQIDSSLSGEYLDYDEIRYDMRTV